MRRFIDNLSGKFYVDQMDWEEVLVGRSIVEASFEEGTLTLDDGTVFRFDKENDDCCSWVELAALRATNNVITAVTVDDDEGEEGEGPYKAWMQVVTDSGEVVNVAELEGDASNGYYLHGFALGVTLERP